MQIWKDSPFYLLITYALIVGVGVNVCIYKLTDFVKYIAILASGA